MEKTAPASPCEESPEKYFLMRTLPVHGRGFSHSHAAPEQLQLQMKQLKLSVFFVMLSISTVCFSQPTHTLYVPFGSGPMSAKPRSFVHAENVKQFAAFETLIGTHDSSILVPAL